MIPIREYTDYGDKLISPKTALAAAEAGFETYCPECFIRSEGDTDAQLLDSYSGLIGEGWEFVCFRPTQSFLQKWFRDELSLNIFVGFRPNVKKWDSHFYSQKLSGKEYVKEQTMKKYLSQTTFDSYEEALEDGLLRAAKHNKDKKE